MRDRLIEFDSDLDCSAHRTRRSHLLQSAQLLVGQVAAELDRDLEPTWRRVIVVVDGDHDLAQLQPFVRAYMTSVVEMQEASAAGKSS